MLSISTFAALLLDWDAVPQGAVLRVSALKSSGTAEEDVEVIDNYYNFEDGWNYAMDLAGDTKKMKITAMIAS